jgi:myo-inositol 2-dehydrogenase / D-chiro-inositol 1-dehydrogenase
VELVKPGSPLRVGIVGAGWIAADHRAVLGNLGHRLVAVCDVDRDRAEGLARGTAAVYEDWRELLDREELDALWIATPPRLHAEPAVAAFERGLPVYLEKPVARTLDDANTIVEAWRRSGSVCAVGYQWHATEALETLRESVAGQPIAALLGISVGPTAARPWFLDRAGGGGNVLERGSHQLDLLRSVAGDVESVQAFASDVVLAQSEGERGDIEDSATLLLRFAGGALGTVVVAWTREGQPGRYSLDVLAEETTLHLELDPWFRLTGRSRDRDVEDTMRVHPFERSVARFVDAVHEGAPAAVFCTPADARETLRTALACERSLLEGGRVVQLSELA